MTRLARRSGRAPDPLGLLLALACWALVVCWAALALCPSDQPTTASRVQRGPGLAVRVPCSTTSTGYPFDDPPVHESVLGWLRGDLPGVVMRWDQANTGTYRAGAEIVAVVSGVEVARWPALECKHEVVTRCAVQGCDPATCDLARCMACGARR